MSEYGRATPDLYMHACLTCVFVGPRPIRRAIIIDDILYIYIYIYMYIFSNGFVKSLSSEVFMSGSQRGFTKYHLAYLYILYILT